MNLFKLFGILAVSIADELVKEFLDGRDNGDLLDEPVTYGDAGDLGPGYRPADEIKRMREERARETRE